MLDTACKTAVGEAVACRVVGYFDWVGRLFAHPEPFRRAQ